LSVAGRIAPKSPARTPFQPEQGQVSGDILWHSPQCPSTVVALGQKACSTAVIHAWTGPQSGHILAIEKMLFNVAPDVIFREKNK